jgi:hypothetical protein
MALSAESQIEEDAGNAPNCTPEGEDGFSCSAPRPDSGDFDLQAAKDDANQKATISTVGFVAGGVLVAAGVTMIVIDMVTGGAVSEEGVAFVPYAGPEGGGAAMTIRF